MEVSPGPKQRQHEFSCVSISQLSPSPSPPLTSVVSASFGSNESGWPQLCFRSTDAPDSTAHRLDLQTAKLFRLGPMEFMCVSKESGTSDAEKSFARAFNVSFRAEDESKVFESEFEIWKHQVIGTHAVMTSEQAEGSRLGGKANWTTHQHAVWVEILHALVIKGCRSGTTLDRHGTVEMMNQFKERTGVEYTRLQFKNHWDSTKKDWRVWKKLIENTDLEWDPIKRTVVADNEWWATWLAQDKNSKYARWREIGLEFQDQLDVIYGGSIATCDMAWPIAMCAGTPTSDRLHLDTQDEDFDSPDTIPETHPSTVDPIGSPAGRRRSNISEPADSRRRKRAGNLDLSEHLSRLVNVLDTRSCADSSGAMSMRDPTSIAACMKILTEMHQVVDKSDLFYFATDLLLKKSTREMFVALPTEEHRYEWLLRKQMHGGGQ